MYVNFGGGDVIVTGRVTSRGAEYKPGEGGKRSVLKFGVDADNCLRYILIGREDRLKRLQR